MESQLPETLRTNRDCPSPDTSVTGMPGIDDPPSEEIKGDSCHRQTQTPLRASSLWNIPASSQQPRGTPRKTTDPLFHPPCRRLSNVHLVPRSPKSSIDPDQDRGGCPAPPPPPKSTLGTKDGGRFSELRRPGGSRPHVTGQRSRLHLPSPGEPSAVRRDTLLEGWLAGASRKLPPARRSQGHRRRHTGYQITKTPFAASGAISQTHGYNNR